MRQLFVDQMTARAPGALNVARQISRRARSWWAHQRTDGYVVSYPGCGRTWLTILIGQAIIADRKITGANPAQLTELSDLGHGIPRLEVRHDDRPQLCRPDQVVHDKSRFAKKRVVMLVRDPRDAIISYYFEASKRRGRFGGTASEFLRHPVGGLDTLIAYYNVWADNRNVPRAFSVVRYEDLQADPIAQLERVTKTLGVSASPAALASAVEHGRFENMRKIEAKGFARAELDRRDPGDAESNKARKGKVGGYREYLSAEDVAYLNARIEERLSPFYDSYLRPT